MVARNATRESARAIHDAMPLLCQAREVHLMCFERVGDLRHVSRLQLDEAPVWLARHGVAARLHQERASGGCGHSRLAEFLLGGVTRRLSAQMTTPVPKSH